MIDESQKRSFMRNGYLILEDGIDESLVDEGRQLVVDEIPEEPDDPASLRGVGSRSPDVPADEPFTTIKRRLYEYATELVGENLQEPSGPHMQLALRYPVEARLGANHDRRPRSGHLDGFGPGYKETGQYSTCMVAGVVYLDDVGDRGGGFTVWPGSHLVAADYFSEHGLNTPGYHGPLPAIDDDGGWDRERRLEDQLRSRELNAPAGSVILWHNKLYHAAGVNQSDRIRMAGINRFSHRDQEEITQDAADKPFKYWDGLEGIERPE